MKFLKALELSNLYLDNKNIDNIVDIVCSISSQNISIYLNAYSNIFSSTFIYNQLEFGTLQQTLYHLQKQDTSNGLILLFPWDILPISSWRDNPTIDLLELEQCFTYIERFFNMFKSIKPIHVSYFDFPFPSHQLDITTFKLVKEKLIKLAIENSFTIHGPESFSLSSFLQTGNPFKQSSLDNLAKTIHSFVDNKNAFNSRNKKPCKIIFTDLDNTFWPGVLAEDGRDSINSLESYNSKIYLHYRLTLRRLAHEGILIIAITRNEKSYIVDTLTKGITGFEIDLFTHILCTYDRKSNSIANCLQRLNLKAADAVFIDDNKLEILEVQSSIRDINVFHFLPEENNYIFLIKKLNMFFRSSFLSDEDRNRRKLYSSMLEFSDTIKSIEESNNGTLLEYLNGLNMVLSVSTTNQDKEKLRSIQLLNKTSQFNSNGAKVLNLNKKDKLIIASLEDTSINHGLVLACVVSEGGVITNCAMSCRVFQRGVESYFFSFLKNKSLAKSIHVKASQRNKPFRDFICKAHKNNYLLTEEPKILSLEEFHFSLPSHKLKVNSTI